MTQISATLQIPAESVDLMQSLLEQIAQLRATIHGDDILTEEEAAKVLKVGLTTLRKWRSENWLPFFSEGKLIKHERRAILEAYKLHFGKETHFEVINRASKWRKAA
ncbi:MAG: helix-turn-helix domain-containing protein [Bacteroidetes bacterium]|nr:helix-turn-helix domain-containing protein [Bacteroidota bacterium]